MSLTDPVADMLTRIRNACAAGHRRVDMPVSKLKGEMARLLKDNHYIADFKVLDDGAHGVLRLYLKYHDESPVIRELRRVSTPGLARPQVFATRSSASPSRHMVTTTAAVIPKAV